MNSRQIFDRTTFLKEKGIYFFNFRFQNHITEISEIKGPELSLAGIITQGRVYTNIIADIIRTFKETVDEAAKLFMSLWLKLKL